MPTDPVNQMLNRIRMRQVALLLAIEEHASLGSAAKAIGITQPAATKMLHELEDALGQPLFDRVGRSLRVNTAGKRALQSFAGVRGTMQQLQRELHELQLGRTGQLSVGSIMAASPTYLTLALAKLKAQYPLVSVTIEVGTSDRLMEQLDNGSLDVVIGGVPASTAGYRFTSLAEEAICVVCAHGHQLTRARQPTFEHLTRYPWVLQPHGSPMRDVIQREFLEHQIAMPREILETSSTMITVHLVSRTRMISTLPESVAQGFRKHKMLGIVRYSIRNRLASFGSLVRADRPLSAQGEHFIRFLHDGSSGTW